LREHLLPLFLAAAVANGGHDAARKLLKAVEEFHTSIENNQGFIPNDSACDRPRERISTGFVESPVNQGVRRRVYKKPPRQWTPHGAHRLLQSRTRVWNAGWEATFLGWYPEFRPFEQRAAA